MPAGINVTARAYSASHGRAPAAAATTGWKLWRVGAILVAHMHHLCSIRPDELRQRGYGPGRCDPTDVAGHHRDGALSAVGTTVNMMEDRRSCFLTTGVLTATGPPADGGSPYSAQFLAAEGGRRDLDNSTDFSSVQMHA